MIFMWRSEIFMAAVAGAIKWAQAYHWSISGSITTLGLRYTFSSFIANRYYRLSLAKPLRQARRADSACPGREAGEIGSHNHERRRCGTVGVPVLRTSDSGSSSPRPSRAGLFSAGPSALVNATRVCACDMSKHRREACFAIPAALITTDAEAPDLSRGLVCCLPPFCEHAPLLFFRHAF